MTKQNREKLKKQRYPILLLSKEIALIYFAIVTGGWALLEAYTYFQGDNLKEVLGPYWTILYLGPLPIALIIGIIRLTASKQSGEETITAKPLNTLLSLPSNAEKLFSYKGLLWRPKFLNLRLPDPLCPRENCQRPVNSIREDPPQFLVSSNPREMQDFLNVQGRYKHIYRCPIHGELREAPDLEPSILKQEAKQEFQRFQQNRR